MNTMAAERNETARVEAFSDGVFAIAITLLIIEIKVPDAESGQLAEALVRLWPSLIYLIAFGVAWFSVAGAVALTFALALFFALPPRKAVKLT